MRWGTDGLDLEAGVVHVRRSLDTVRDKRTDEYSVNAPKSRASHRTVPLAPEDIARLRLHRLAAGRRDDDLVFGGTDGEVLSPVPGHRAFDRAATRAGIAQPLPRFHDTRRRSPPTHWPLA